jgi:putative ABC transport system permease protein
MIWELAFRELERHKLRTFLTMLGVVIGVFLVTTVSSLSEGITSYVNEQISITSGLITVREKETPGFAIERSQIEKTIADEIRNMGGVEKVGEVLYVKYNGQTIIGVSPEHRDLIRGVDIKIEEGREYESDQYEVVLGKKIAEESGYSVSDVITIFDKKFEIVGILEETGKNQIDNSIFMDLSVLQDISNKKEFVTLIFVQPSRAEDADLLEQEINDNFDEVKASTDKSLMNLANKTLSQLNLMTFAIGSIAALISGIVIMNVMMISVRERRREIGTMKAIGATNKQILFSIVFEAILISFFGAVLGLILSFSGTAFLNTILLRPLALITPRLILQGILLSISIGIISSILPARHAARLNPVEALRYE